MRAMPRVELAALVAAITLLAAATGCTSLPEYVRNGFKVGPNYATPPAPVAQDWIDPESRRMRDGNADLNCWWTVFDDPVLERLIHMAYEQDLTLREAGFRVLEARAQLGIAAGNMYPQSQTMHGSYTRQGISLNPPLSAPFTGRRYSDQWNFGFNLAWELDFWGRFRRAVQAAEAQLDASVENYDDVLVTLLGDVATNYIQVRTDQQRIVLLEKNRDAQLEVLEIIRRRAKPGVSITSPVDLHQAESNLAQTTAQIPQVEIDMRLANNRLCTLLGVPPGELQSTLDLWRAVDMRKKAEVAALREKIENAKKTIREALNPAAGGGPVRPNAVIEAEIGLGRALEALATVYVPKVDPNRAAAIGVPADLLRRRPDVRRAERQAAAQAEAIGIAESDLYPAFTINGTLGWQARQFSHLFTQEAFNGSIGPSFQWNILNYGRIANNVLLQDATFQELVLAYQQTVLQAGEEVENGLVTYIKAQEREALLKTSARSGEEAIAAFFGAVGGGLGSGAPGGYTYLQYAVIEQSLVQQEDSWAQSQGEIAQGLIQVYRALGGGWQIRCQPGEAAPAGATAVPPDAPIPPEELPVPPGGMKPAVERLPVDVMPQPPKVEAVPVPPNAGPMPEMPKENPVPEPPKASWRPGRAASQIAARAGSADRLAIPEPAAR